MTVGEAERIEQQIEAGAIDPELPGTMDVVNEARRTRLQAYMWGSQDGKPLRRRKRVLIASTCGVALLTITGLILSFVAAR